MAILKPSVNNSNPFAEVIGDDLAPAGTFVATILDIDDEFGVERRKYQSEELEKADLATFLFGFRDKAGNAHRVASKRMKISGNEKSALFGFLKSILGRKPDYGWDYCELKGEKVLLTVELVERHDGEGKFAAIAAISPLPEGYAEPAPAATPAPRKRRVADAVPPPPPPPPVQDAEDDDEIPF